TRAQLVKEAPSMKKFSCSPAALCAAAVLVCSAPSLAQLAPPPGPVAPTQSREIFALPFTITAHGSYRTERNLTATAAAVIVTIEDMMLSNATSNGIAAANGKPSIIRNVIVDGAGFNGVAASQGSLLENVTVRNAVNSGFDCNGQTVFRGCAARGCGNHGFFV